MTDVEDSKSIEEELWNIFTYYSMHGNPRDPVKLNSVALVKFCRDIMVLDFSMTERPILAADVHLLFTAEIKRNQLNTRSHQEGKDKLSYEEFLSCLSHLAVKCYPSASSSEEAMQTLLMDNILPLALRRQPSNIASIVHHAPIENVLVYFVDPLKELYQYYASSTEKRAQVSNIIKTTSKHSMTFDEHKEDIEIIEHLSKTKTANFVTTSLCQMQYSDFIKFAQDFGLVQSIGLTNLDIADIFLTVTALTDFSPELGRFDYKQFCEALVRCALTAYASYINVSSTDKLKAMFLSIWRHIHSTMQEQLVSYKGSTTGTNYGHSGGFLRGSQMFNERFISLWTKDGYLDYLEGKVSSQGDQAVGAATMNSLLSQLSLSSTPSSPRSPLRSPSSQLNPDHNKKKKLLSPNAIPALQRTRKLEKSTTPTRVVKGIHEDKQRIQRRFVFDIEDDDHVGDDRINAADLRKLLKSRPDIADMLYGFIKELGLEDS